MKKLSLFFLIVFFYGSAMPQQQQELDSMEALLPNLTGIKKVKLLDDLGWNYLYTEPEKSRKYSKQALLILEKYPQEKSSKSIIYKNLGAYFLVTSNYDSALYYFDKSIALKTEIDDEKGIVGVRSNKAMIYQLRGQFDKAAIEQDGVVEYYEATNDSLNLASALNNLAELHKELNYNSKANAIQLRTLKIRKAIKDTSGIAASMLSLSRGYSVMGNREKALSYLDSALYYAQKAQRPTFIATILHNKSVFLLEEEKYQEAEKLVKEAIEISKELEDKWNLTSSINVLAEIYTKTNRYKQSLKILKEAQFYESQLKSHDLEMLTYERMAENYSLIGMADSTLHYAKLAQQMQDSLYNQQSANALQEYQTRYETTKKEAENQALKYDNALYTIEKEKAEKEARWILLGSLAIILILIGIAFVLYKFNQIKAQRREEQKVSMALVEGEQKEQIRLARELHDSLGQKLAVVKMHLSSNAPNQKTGDLVDDAITEVRNISHKIMPEDLSFGFLQALENLQDKIEVLGETQVTLEAEIQETDIKLNMAKKLNLYRILQETLGNMIKHAHASQINIQLSKKGNHLFLYLQDNGQGLSTNAIYDSKGMGWNNILLRSRLLGGKIQVHTKEKTGTSLQLTIPNE